MKNRLWAHACLSVALVTAASCGGAQPQLADPESAPQASRDAHRLDTVGAQAGAETGAAREEPERPTRRGLVGVTWQWVRFVDPIAGGVDVPHSERYTVLFDEDGTFEVRADCNEGHGAYLTDQDDLRLRFEEATGRRCGIHSLSAEFFDNLNAAERYARVRDRLAVFVRWGTARLEFVPAEAADVAPQ